MFKNRIFIILIYLLIGIRFVAQSQESTLITFYNLENLFDIEIDPFVDDNAFSPNGQNRWNIARYNQKITHIATVIASIENQEKLRPVLVGICEVETYKVLDDLCKTEKLKSFNYGIVHFNSQEEKGLDVALLYQKDKFQILEKTSYTPLHENSSMTSKNMIMVSGILNQTDTLYLIIGHWSDNGEKGERQVFQERTSEANLIKSICDSIWHYHQNPQIILMGDFNESPKSLYTNYKLTSDLSFNENTNDLSYKSLYNPMQNMEKQGLGSYVKGDIRYLYDQFILSKCFISKSYKTNLELDSIFIYEPTWLKIKTGTYQGYPYSTYMKSIYIGGYSDHFPICMKLISKL